MSGTKFSRDNHYVPRGYLKRWTRPSKKVFVYRTLVPHEEMPPWKECSIAGVAYHEHLYTRLIAGKESSEIEEWFANEYESPAEAVIQKATTGTRLSRDEWRVLIRFLAAQDVRTPVKLLEHLQRAEQTFPAILESSMNKAVERMVSEKKGIKQPITKRPLVEYLPVRVTTHINPGEKTGTLRAEAIVGRGTWLFSIRHLLTNTADILHKHKWTILLPAAGMSWPTSDDPVIRLNFTNTEKYNFGGGWDRKGSQILFPLSPQHLLYTNIGSTPPVWGSRCSIEATQLFRRFIIEHAHRMVFAQEIDSEVPIIKPRTVDREEFINEKAQWSNWHNEQVAAETKLMAKS